MSAILIGISYHGTDDFLPGIIIDLFRVYHYVKKKGFDIKVFTDVKQEYFSYQKMRELDLNFNDNINNFINILINKNQYFYINGSICFKKYSLCDKCLIYFTGHGSKSGLMMPDNSYISYSNFKNMFFSCDQTMVIYDCCYYEGMIELFNDGSKDMIYILPKTYDILTSKNGSIFTKIILEILQSKVTNIREIKDKANKKIKESYNNINLINSKFNFDNLIDIITKKDNINDIWEWVIEEDSLNIYYKEDKLVIKKYQKNNIENIK